MADGICTSRDCRDVSNGAGAAADYVRPRGRLPKPEVASGTTDRVGLWDDARPGPAGLLSGHGPARAAAGAASAGALDRDRLRVHGTGAGVRRIEGRAIPAGSPILGSRRVVAVAVVPAAFRRCWPRTVLALVVVAAAVATALSSVPWLVAAFVSPVLWLVAAFATYVIPLRFPRRDALRLLAGTLLVMATGLTAFAINPDGGYGPETGTIGKAVGLLLEGGLLVTVAWLIGYSVRQQRRQVADRREQAERRAREQQAEARRARSEERLRISRELHDVVAHTLSVIAVQAGVASYVIAERPEEAARALSSIEQTSRSALHEMRALLGVLRDAGDRSRNGAGPGTAGRRAGTSAGAGGPGQPGRAGRRGRRPGGPERPRRAAPLPAGLDLAALPGDPGSGHQRHQARVDRPVPGDGHLPGRKR